MFRFAIVILQISYIISIYIQNISMVHSKSIRLRLKSIASSEGSGEGVLPLGVGIGDM